MEEHSEAHTIELPDFSFIDRDEQARDFYRNLKRFEYVRDRVKINGAWIDMGIDVTPFRKALGEHVGFPYWGHTEPLVNSYPFLDEEMSAITSMHVLQHEPAPILALHEYYRMLCKGGRLYLTVPNADSWAIRYEAGAQFTTGILVDLLTGFGFNIDVLEIIQGRSVGIIRRHLKDTIYIEAVK